MAHTHECKPWQCPRLWQWPRAFLSLVRVAEKTVLQAAKREAVMLVINLQSKRGGSMEGSESLEGESSEEDADSDDGDDDDDEEEMGSEEEAELLQQLLRAKQKQEQKQQAGAANTKRGTAEQQQPSGSSGHGGKRMKNGAASQGLENGNPIWQLGGSEDLLALLVPGDFD
eukprot:1139993-Pelagomonas_calceolata.AAC.6